MKFFLPILLLLCSTVLNGAVGDAIFQVKTGTTSSTETVVPKAVSTTIGWTAGGTLSAVPNGEIDAIVKSTPTGGGSGELWLWDSANGEYSVLELTDTEWTFDGLINAPGFSGDGSSLTNLNASNLSSGTVANARLDATLTAIANASNGSDTILYFTATDAVSSTGISALSRTLLGYTLAGQWRQKLSTDGLTSSTGSGGFVMREDAQLDRADFVDATFLNAATWADGTRQVFNPNGTNAGLNVGGHTADPSSPVNGDLVYNSTGNTLRAYINGAWVNLGSAGISGTVGTTDNALPRANGTGGSTLQGSLVTIADNGTLTKDDAYELGTSGSNYGRIGLWDADNNQWMYFQAGPSKIIFPDIQATGFSGNGSSITALNAGNITSGTLPLARLGSSGTASSTTYLRGDNTWATPAGGSGSYDSTITSLALLAAKSTTALPGNTLLTVTINTEVQDWILNVTTLATTAGIQRPNDYNAITNTKVWIRRR
jgi:hypothetical protein